MAEKAAALACENPPDNSARCLIEAEAECVATVMTNIYETIGRDYNRKRREDPRIALAIRAALGTCKSIANIGAGAGSYEPADLDVISVAPSFTQ
jgi:hypothetical protein